MQVWLAQVEGTRLLLPVRISVQTMIGLSIVEVQNWVIRGR
jgi:hypothetical protein